MQILLSMFLCDITTNKCNNFSLQDPVNLHAGILYKSGRDIPLNSFLSMKQI